MDKWLKDPELDACQLRGSYFGMYSSARKGSEYILLLELVHKGSQKLIWREYVVLYSAQKAKLQDATAKSLIDPMNAKYDFTNLE